MKIEDFLGAEEDEDGTAGAEGDRFSASSRDSNSLTAGRGGKPPQSRWGLPTHGR